MSYTSALQRVTELRGRIGVDTNLRTIGSQGFDKVLATAQNRFQQGPARLVSASPDVNSGQWGNNPNNASLATQARAAGGTAAAMRSGSSSADIASPGFATPAKVNGWSSDLEKMVDAASERFGVPRELVIGVARAESAFRSDAGSGAGAKGLMQLMPATAKGLGVTDITDPWQNLAGGTKYLRQLLDRFDGDAKKAVAGYNAGPGAVERYGGTPPYAETRTYVARVFDYAGELGWQP